MADAYKNDRTDVTIADIQRIQSLVQEFRESVTNYQTARGFGKSDHAELAQTAKELVAKARAVVDLANHLHIVRKKSMQTRGLWAGEKMMSQKKSKVIRHMNPNTDELETATIVRKRLEFCQDAVTHVEGFATQILSEWMDTTGKVKPPGYKRSKDRIWIAAKISDPKPKVV